LKVIDSGISIVIIVLGAFLVSVFGSFSLSQELEWYKEQEFPVSEQDYSILSESLSSYTIDRHFIDRIGLREQALYVYDLYREIVVYYDTDESILYLVAHKFESNQRVMVFVWKASIG